MLYIFNALLVQAVAARCAPQPGLQSGFEYYSIRCVTTDGVVSLCLCAFIGPVDVGCCWFRFSKHLRDSYIATKMER